MRPNELEVECPGKKAATCFLHLSCHLEEGLGHIYDHSNGLECLGQGVGRGQHWGRVEEGDCG